MNPFSFFGFRLVEKLMGSVLIYISSRSHTKMAIGGTNTHWTLKTAAWRPYNFKRIRGRQLHRLRDDNVKYDDRMSVNAHGNE